MTDITCKSDVKRTLHTAARIVDIQQDNFRTRTFVLDAGCQALPGQYVMIWQPGFDEKPFSLVDSDPVTIMITSVGPTTRLFHEQRVGDKLWLRGPFGNGFSVADDVQHALLVGGGYGVAPLLFLADRMLDHVPRISVAIGAQKAEALLYADRFRSLQGRTSTRLDLHLSTDDGSVGNHGFVTIPVEHLLQQNDVDCLYACGPDVMLQALRLQANEHDVPCQLSWEAYMRCGMGLCGSCEHEGQLLCMDGPVLRYKE